MEKLEQQQSGSVRNGILCAKWKKLSDGCVARCDQLHGHEGKHLDSVILISWSESVSATPIDEHSGKGTYQCPRCEVDTPHRHDEPEDDGIVYL